MVGKKWKKVLKNQCVLALVVALHLIFLTLILAYEIIFVQKLINYVPSNDSRLMEGTFRVVRKAWRKDEELTRLTTRNAAELLTF